MCVSSSLALTLQFALSVGAVDAPQLCDGPRRPQVEHDYINPGFHRLPRLRPFAHRHALLQQGQEGEDMGEGGAGQWAALWRTDRRRVSAHQQLSTMVYMSDVSTTCVSVLIRGRTFIYHLSIHMSSTETQKQTKMDSNTQLSVSSVSHFCLLFSH